MEATITLRLNGDGRYTLLSGERELVHGLDAAQAQRFADSLDGIIEVPAREPAAVSPP